MHDAFFSFFAPVFQIIIKQIIQIIKKTSPLTHKRETAVYHVEVQCFVDLSIHPDLGLVAQWYDSSSSFAPVSWNCRGLFHLNINRCCYGALADAAILLCPHIGLYIMHSTYSLCKKLTFIYYLCLTRTMCMGRDWVSSVRKLYGAKSFQSNVNVTADTIRALNSVFNHIYFHLSVRPHHVPVLYDAVIE